MEYLTIVGFVMVIIIPMLVIFYDFKSEAADTIRSSQVRQVGMKIVDTAETIYFLGEPSSTLLRIYLPDKIQSVEMLGREIVFNISTRVGVDQIVMLSEVNVTGTIPNNAGLHNMRFQSHGTYVDINPLVG
ncbi:hypothetical protein COV93_01195 [Candidatus Woesearchaeota archaeon CG11_big_fil_rev_8_21_14_0_20_43_8]|nr:MAG: hypothetical protein COV93_01195 [Candidatus Woesearchaeota archaeon CG11_big_fil_rev_8_21_14_0_20_43_8]PIO05626.1 MAG: hypothetical protein COT47_03960 [Candidatus Woesearchaeota archaeon CG08_land_8_20_14_0_20_43_7]